MQWSEGTEKGRRSQIHDGAHPVSPSGWIPAFTEIRTSKSLQKGFVKRVPSLSSRCGLRSIRSVPAILPACLSEESPGLPF